MIILNGRSSSDQEGEFTCKKTSVVDYCISNTEFLKHVQDFIILPFSPFLSDVQIHIEVLLALGNQDNTESIYQQAQTKELAKKWNSEMKDTYHNHVEDKSENILMLTNELSNIRHENISLKVIDNALEKICDILVGSALDVFGKKPIYTNVKKYF